RRRAAPPRRRLLPGPRPPTRPDALRARRRGPQKVLARSYGSHTCLTGSVALIDLNARFRPEGAVHMDSEPRDQQVKTRRRVVRRAAPLATVAVIAGVVGGGIGSLARGDATPAAAAP